MKVILLKDVKGQGKKDNIIDVSSGYANNFLIKNNLAVAYSETSKKILDNEIIMRELEESELLKKLNIIKNDLNDKIIEFKVKTGKEDKVFGTISSKQISDKFNELGYKINKKNIIIENPISNLGTHKVLIKLHKKVEFFVNIKLIK
ncbi:MAG: 50S ribosomal protein L9 [Bacilli bacterium]